MAAAEPGTSSPRPEAPNARDVPDAPDAPGVRDARDVRGGAMLSAEHVRRIARLARLAIPDERIERYRSDLAAVLGYADRLRALPLEGVEPMASPIDAPARLDDDVPGPSLPTAVLMEMAPETAGPFVKVPKVIGEGA